MKKLIASAFVLSLLSSAAIAADPVKIGFLSTFSGPAGQLGQELLDGFNLALEENGKTIGGRPVEVIQGDDQAKPDVGRQAADARAPVRTAARDVAALAEELRSIDIDANGEITGLF